MRVELTRELLSKYVIEGKTQREIAKLTGYSKSNVGYWIRKYDISHLNDNKPEIDYKDKYFFNKINTPEKAYIVGYIVADGYVNNKIIELTTAIKDIEILKFIQSELGGNIRKDYTYDKSTRRFPNARLRLHDKTLIKNLIKQIGGTYKSDRRLPRINPDLEKYLLLGFFDGDGCITWGRRKDRNRLWHKISFTSQYKSLLGVQNILYNQVGIPSNIKPKSDGSNCFVLEFANRDATIKYLEYIYSDLIVLERKYQNANNLRLELEEFGKS